MSKYQLAPRGLFSSRWEDRAWEVIIGFLIKVTKSQRKAGGHAKSPGLWVSISADTALLVVQWDRPRILQALLFLPIK